MSTIRVLIVDDEAPARARMRRLVGAHPDVAVCGEAADGDEAMQRILEQKPDLVFLDVDMPGTSGIEIAGRIIDYLPESVRPLVVFTTAHAEHAVKAFELQSLDYLLKPVERDRLANTLRRVRSKLWAHEPAASAPIATPETALTGHHGASIEAIAIGSIVLLEVEDGVVFATTHDPQRHRLTQSLGELESRLPSPPFVRASRAAMVNIERVDKLTQSTDGWMAVLEGGAKVKISRRRTRALRDLLNL